MSNKKNAAALKPVDLARCQSERHRNFMQLGGHKVTRCMNKSVYVARENKPGADKLHGAMGLCQDCAKILVDQHGRDYATLFEIAPRLTIHEAKEILAIKGGADIYGLGNAAILRGMQRRGLAVNQQQKGSAHIPNVSIACALFTITEPMQAPKNGAKRQPYFGAIATAHGLKLARGVAKAEKAKG